MTTIINFLGGPGAGKSTLAAETFAKLKHDNINVELVTEYAKDLVWEESYKALDDQIYVFGKQLHKINMLLNQVDYIITDAPLFNSIVYYNGTHDTFKPLVLSVINSIPSQNYLVKRVKHYNPKGRLQSEQNAKDLDNTIETLLKEHHIHYTSTVSDSNSAMNIATTLKNLL